MAIYNTAITVWKRSEEGRRAVYSRLVLSPVRFEPTRGATPGTDGDQTARSATLLVPGNLGQRISRKDKVAYGNVAAAEPVADAFTVQTAKPVAIGKRVHHWEFELE